MDSNPHLVFLQTYHWNEKRKIEEYYAGLAESNKQ
jgi:hypothetical protein